MAQNTTTDIPALTWTQLTDADIASITFQNRGGSDLLVKATTDTTAPTSSVGALRYPGGMGERNVLLADLFPGIAGAARLWAWSDQPLPVFVSHG